MKAKRIVVGLTGGIGSGKSTALKEFARGGAATVDLDGIAREQARPGGPAYKKIVRDFGTCILKRDGTIDRPLLGRVVFSDRRARLGLEKAVHPLILAEMKRRIARSKGVVIVDVPLLFEKKLQRDFDVTVCIAASRKNQLRRNPDAAARMKSQLPLSVKRRLADVVISNDSSLPAFKAAVRSYHAGLRLLQEGRR